MSSSTSSGYVQRLNNYYQNLGMVGVVTYNTWESPDGKSGRVPWNASVSAPYKDPRTGLVATVVLGTGTGKAQSKQGAKEEAAKAALTLLGVL